MMITVLKSKIHRATVTEANVGYVGSITVDITLIQAFQMLLQMFRTMLTENTELSDEKISELVDAFINALPIMLKTQLQAA